MLPCCFLVSCRECSRETSRCSRYLTSEEAWEPDLTAWTLSPSRWLAAKCNCSNGKGKQFSYFINQHWPWRNNYPSKKKTRRGTVFLQTEGTKSIEFARMSMYYMVVRCLLLRLLLSTSFYPLPRNGFIYQTFRTFTCIDRHANFFSCHNVIKWHKRLEFFFTAPVVLISFLSEINISRWAHIDSIRNSERRGEPKLLMYGLWPVWCLFCVSKYPMVLAIALA